LNRAAACAASARQLRDKPLRTDSITSSASASSVSGIGISSARALVRFEARWHLCHRVQDRCGGDFDPQDRDGSGPVLPGANALGCSCPTFLEGTSWAPRCFSNGALIRRLQISKEGARDPALLLFGRGSRFWAFRFRTRSRWQASLQYSCGFAQLCPVVSNSADKPSRLIARDPIGTD
jgi:hypothetical protein